MKACCSGCSAPGRRALRSVVIACPSQAAASVRQL
jgi:hypothetical protein